MINRKITFVAGKLDQRYKPCQADIYNEVNIEIVSKSNIEGVGKRIQTQIL